MKINNGVLALILFSILGFLLFVIASSKPQETPHSVRSSLEWQIERGRPKSSYERSLERTVDRVIDRHPAAKNLSADERYAVRKVGVHMLNEQNKRRLIRELSGGGR